MPEKGYTFGTLIRAQAEGAFPALKSRNRRALRVNLGNDAPAALAEIPDNGLRPLKSLR